MIRRMIEESIGRAMADTPVVLINGINGARQTGKTTFAQAIAAKSGAQCFTLDAAATLALAAAIRPGSSVTSPGQSSSTSHLVGADARRLRDDRSLLGRLLETFVVSELRKQASWTYPLATLHHFRTATGSEVDVILENPDGSLAAIEVKASATAAASDFAALKSLRDRLGKRFLAGVVLYLGEQALPFGDLGRTHPIPLGHMNRAADGA